MIKDPKTIVLWVVAGLSILWMFLLSYRSIGGESTAPAPASTSGRPPIHFFGQLTPANDPVIPNLPNDSLILLLGDDLAVTTRNGRRKVFVHNGQEFLTIGLEGGQMWITTSVSDKEEKFIARIIKNEFQAFNERAFNPRKRMPDDHTFLVRDQNGEEVLYVRFKNARTIRLTGRFMIENSRALVVDAKKGIIFPEGGGIGHMTLSMMGAGDGDAAVLTF